MEKKTTDSCASVGIFFFFSYWMIPFPSAPMTFLSCTVPIPWFKVKLALIPWESCGNTLERMEQAGVKLHKEKCVYRQAEQRFLGRIVDASGVTADPSKVSAIRDLKAPTLLCSERLTVNMSVPCDARMSHCNFTGHEIDGGLHCLLKYRKEPKRQGGGPKYHLIFKQKWNWGWKHATSVRQTSAESHCTLHSSQNVHSWSWQQTCVNLMARTTACYETFTNSTWRCYSWPLPWGSRLLEFWSSRACSRVPE